MSATTSTSKHFDLQAFVRAIEADDPAKQLAAYSPDAVVQTLNRDHGPGAPLTVRGQDGLSAVFKDVASRELRHEVTRAIADDHTGALEVHCAYPDGTEVCCLSTFDVADGQIVRETRLEVWDG